MKALALLQITLGIGKLFMAFSRSGSKRRTWHLLSGAAIILMGLEIAWHNA